MPGYKRLLVLACVVVAGCAGGPEPRREANTGTTITASFAEMRFAPLPLSEWQSITLDSAQPAFGFSSGRSFYAARVVARSPMPRTLRFRTFLSGPLPPQASVLVPRFVFLNQAKQPVRLALRYELRRGTDAARGVFFEGEVPVPAGAGYFVLFTADAPGPGVRAVAADGQEHVVPHAMTGTVDVMVSAAGVG